MVVFLSIGTIAGVLLGLRFKVFVLAPAILLATGVIIASGHEPKMTALTVWSCFRSDISRAVLFGHTCRHVRPAA